VILVSVILVSVILVSVILVSVILVSSSPTAPKQDSRRGPYDASTS
jgi:hypothetical protein